MGIIFTIVGIILVVAAIVILATMSYVTCPPDHI